MNEMRILAPQGLLGYGFPIDAFLAGVEEAPDLIGVDGGSTDPGPYYLGAGKSFTDRGAVKRDTEIILEAALAREIPVVIGSAGGSGGRPHVDWMLEIVREIARERNWHFGLARVDAEIDKDFIKKRLREGRVRPFEFGSALKDEVVDQAPHIVAQMGMEPLQKALELGVNVVVAGRAYDPAIFAALAIQRGYDPGLATHLGKILECGAIAAVPGSASDCLMGYLGDGYFMVEPTNPARRCTVTSVAAHTLYEKTHPQILPGPGGYLDLTGVAFEQVSERRVRVSGSRFVPTTPYTVKLEGAVPVGFRTISIAGVRCPTFVAHLDEILSGVTERVRDVFSHVPAGSYRILFHVYGRNGVMGDLEPQKVITSHELGMIIEVVADTQELANAICSVVRATMLHYGYPGRIATAGNLALLYSPSDIPMGPVYEFGIYHLMELDNPCEVFPVKVEEL